MDILLGIIKLLKKTVSKLEEIKGRRFRKYYESIETTAESKRWREVLKKISDYAPHQYGYKVDDNHNLLKKLKMSSVELDLCISFLENNGLIEHIPKKDGFGNIGLTKKGFDTSFEIEKIESERRFKMYTIIISVLAIIVSGTLVAVNVYKLLYPSCV